MTNETLKVSIKPELTEALTQAFEANSEINLVSLCTIDGFSISAESRGSFRVEPDKMAAMASTLCSLGNSCARQIMHQEFSVTTVETDNGNMLFLRTNYQKLACVLCIAVKKEMSLATARFVAKRLASDIVAISGS